MICFILNMQYILISYMFFLPIFSVSFENLTPTLTHVNLVGCESRGPESLMTGIDLMINEVSLSRNLDLEWPHP